MPFDQRKSHMPDARFGGVLIAHPLRARVNFTHCDDFHTDR